MKLGQMASYLDDGLPEPLRLALSQLQSDAPPMSVDLAIETVERELGRPVDEVFVEFDPNPIAAASIGQVHRALLRDPATGVERAVAVKVQYPGVGDAIVADLKNADLLGAVLRQGFGGLDPAEMVDEIKLRIAEEVDYEREARNQQAFADYYRGHPFIRIPEVVPELSTTHVLTTELADGFGWAELMRRPQAERDRAGEVIFRFVFRSLYRMGAFNGDPHPGNYLFHDDGTVTFLDFGLVKHFSADEMPTFGSMVKAAAVDHDHAEFRRIVERRRHAQPGCPGVDRRGRRVLLALLRHGAHRRRDDLDPRLRQLDRAPHVRSHEPDQPVRHRSAGVRVHPAHQPRAVRPARRTGRDAATTGASRRSCGRSSTGRPRPISVGRSRLARHRT